jgi:hypothetical protein
MGRKPTEEVWVRRYAICQYATEDEASPGTSSEAACGIIKLPNAECAIGEADLANGF